MTVSIDNVSLGDKLYFVKENLHFHRARQTKIIDGVEYYRSVEPRREYIIEGVEVVGILTKELDGYWPDNEDYELDTQVALEYLDRKDTIVVDKDWFELKRVFATLKEAQEERVEKLAKAVERFGPMYS